MEKKDLKHVLNVFEFEFFTTKRGMEEISNFCRKKIEFICTSHFSDTVGHSREIKCKNSHKYV